MATLYFVRHAKSEMNLMKVWSGRTDCNITEEGKEIARAELCYKQSDFDAFFCSPLKRTWQTLEAIIENLNDTPIIDERLIERDFGYWEGMPYDIIDSQTTELYIQGLVQPPNGETYKEVKERVISFVNDMFNKYKHNEKILIVTHATIVRMVRDVFLPNMEKKPITNTQILMLTDTDWRHYNE